MATVLWGLQGDLVTVSSEKLADIDRRWVRTSEGFHRAFRREIAYERLQSEVPILYNEASEESRALTECSCTAAAEFLTKRMYMLDVEDGSVLAMYDVWARFEDELVHGNTLLNIRIMVTAQLLPSPESEVLLLAIEKACTNSAILFIHAGAALEVTRPVYRDASFKYSTDGSCSKRRSKSNTCASRSRCGSGSEERRWKYCIAQSNKV